MKKIIKLTESELISLVKRVINEGLHDTSWQNDEGDKITLMDLLNATEDIPVEKVSVEELKPHLLTWDDDEEEIIKIDSADLQYPILIFVDNDGEFISIIDGHHRAQKAVRKGLETIKAKVIPINDLPKDIRKVFSHMGGQEEMKEGELTEKCWKGYTQKGMKTMFGKRYPNCVKKTKLREDIELNPNERVYDYEEGRDTVPEKLPFDIDKLVNSGVVFVTPAINGNPKSKNYKKWMKTPHTHLISLYNVENSSEDGWILKAITKRASTEGWKDNFVDKLYDGKYNQILWSLEKLGINPMDMLNDANLQESIIKVLREESTQDSLYEIIITENQQESIKIELQSMVKDIGWELTAKIVNGPKKLVKLAFNNDPMEFLNLFNDLNVVQSREEFYWSLFRYKKRNNLMIYDRKNNSLNVSKKIFWSFLEEGFGLNHSKIRELMRIWLYDTYNLKGDRTFELISVFDWEKSSLSRMG